MIGSKEYYEELQQKFAEEFLKVENGDINHLDCLISFEQDRSYLEESLKIIKSFKDENIDQIESESKEKCGEFRGYKIEVRSGSRKFNFKGIKEHQEKSKELKGIEERAKQAFLSKQKGLLNVDENGEEIQLPEISYNKGSVILKKIK